MTCRPEGDSDDDNAARERALEATGAYGKHFGQAFGVWGRSTPYGCRWTLSPGW
jgi:hypothetical protein